MFIITDGLQLMGLPDHPWNTIPRIYPWDVKKGRLGWAWYDRRKDPVKGDLFTVWEDAKTGEICTNREGRDVFPM